MAQETSREGLRGYSLAMEKSWKTEACPKKSPTPTVIICTMRGFVAATVNSWRIGVRTYVDDSSYGTGARMQWCYLGHQWALDRGNWRADRDLWKMRIFASFCVFIPAHVFGLEWLLMVEQHFVSFVCLINTPLVSCCFQGFLESFQYFLGNPTGTRLLCFPQESHFHARQCDDWRRSNDTNIILTIRSSACQIWIHTLIIMSPLVIQH